MGTLRAAKKRGVVHYEGQLLLQGVHDDVEVVLLPQQTTTASTTASTSTEKEEKEAEAAGDAVAFCY